MPSVKLTVTAALPLILAAGTMTKFRLPPVPFTVSAPGGNSAAFDDVALATITSLSRSCTKKLRLVLLSSNILVLTSSLSCAKNSGALLVKLTTTVKGRVTFRPVLSVTDTLITTTPVKLAVGVMMISWVAVMPTVPMLAGWPQNALTPSERTAMFAAVLGTRVVFVDSAETVAAPMQSPSKLVNDSGPVVLLFTMVWVGGNVAKTGASATVVTVIGKEIWLNRLSAESARIRIAAQRPESLGRGEARKV